VGESSWNSWLAFISGKLQISGGRKKACDYWIASCPPGFSGFAPSPLFVLEAELAQNGRTMASATAKFIDREGI
jgi:hypothetical protein